MRLRVQEPGRVALGSDRLETHLQRQVNIYVALGGKLGLSLPISLRHRARFYPLGCFMEQCSGDRWSETHSP